MNIYEKMNAIMSEVEYLAKDDNVSFGQTKYKALSEEKVTTVMREKMVKYKLIVFPIEMVSSRSGNLSHVDVRYRIVNAEAPDESIEVVSCGDGADTQDKGAGKAMTYAYKYMWLRTFALPTGEDPDKISSEQLDAEQNPNICEKCGNLIVPVKKRNGEMWMIDEIAAYSQKAYGKCYCAACLKELQK